MTSRKKAFQYLTKYMLKVSEFQEVQFTGRRWARSKNLPCSPISEFSLSASELKRLQAIVRLLLARKNKLSERIEEMMASDYGYFVWFEPSEILGILKFINDSANMNRYLRYLETGSPDQTHSELAELAR